ncbi:MAG: DUF1501 domain-containing protein [Wenzhouxiangellaceae bacterium]
MSIPKKKRIIRHLHPVLSRRRFLQMSGAAAGTAALGLTFAPSALGGAADQKVLIYVFLRGGTDGLSLLPPVNGADYGHYRDARDRTLVDINDSDSNRRPIPLINGQGLGFHPYCSGLANIYSDGGLAVIQAAGHPPDTFTRSHFDAQEQIELGQPLITGGSGQSLPASGWLTRYLETRSDVPAVNAIFTAMVSNSTPPASLGGWPDVATLDSPDNFSPNTGQFGDTHVAVLSSLYSGTGELDVAGGAALDAIDLIDSLDLDNYQPAGGVEYPNSSEGGDLQLVAQLIRQNIGIACATVDVGGWDTHNSQNVFGGGFGSSVEDLSEALTAFYRDLEAAGVIDNVAVVVQSEFGRQVKENANAGTDHGLGNPMLVLGGGVSGGRVYGPTDGIAPGAREGDSLVPRTDFRNVLGEVASGLLGNNNVDLIFQDPDFLYQPVGFSS